MGRASLKSIYIVIVSLLFTVGFNCCKRDNAPILQPPPVHDIFFRLYTYFDSTAVNFDNGGPDTATSVETKGRKIALKAARIIISDVRFNHGNNTYYTVPDFAFVNAIDTTEYTITQQIPYGTYTIPSFKLGLPADSNDLTPGSFPIAGYLGARFSTMWTGKTTTGYYWIKFEGWVDTSTAGTGPATCPFSILISAANSPEIPIVLSALEALDSDSAFVAYPPLSASNPRITVSMIINYAYLFNGVNLVHATPAMLNTTLNPTFAATVIQNAKVTGSVYSGMTGSFIHYSQ